MKFNPTTQDEIDTNALWPKGVYAFNIVSAEQKISWGGNEMFELRYSSHEHQGGQGMGERRGQVRVGRRPNSAAAIRRVAGSSAIRFVRGRLETTRTDPRSPVRRMRRNSAARPWSGRRDYYLRTSSCAGRSRSRAMIFRCGYCQSIDRHPPSSA
jgi:hypothetical protein